MPMTSVVDVLNCCFWVFVSTHGFKPSSATKTWDNKNSSRLDYKNLRAIISQTETEKSNPHFLVMIDAIKPRSILIKFHKHICYDDLHLTSHCEIIFLLEHFQWGMMWREVHH